MARAKQSARGVTAPIAIIDLELALVREQLARDAWNLPLAMQELVRMQKISQQTRWSTGFTRLLPALETAIDECMDTVRNRDTTRIQAAHTRLQRSISALRDQLYK